MSSRSIRKRRHREDFLEYSAARQQFKGIASQWKKFGFPSEAAFVKALFEHAKNQNQPATEHTHIDDVSGGHGPFIDLDKISELRGEHEHNEGCTHHHDDRSVHAHVHGENCNHDAAEETEQQKLRDGIEASHADDRAAFDFLTEEGND